MRQCAVVTGGASGIGLATAERLLDDGWQVALVDASEEALAAAESVLESYDAMFVHADVSDEDDVSEAFDQIVDGLGLIGALVNSAAIARDLTVEETSAEILRQMLDINLVGSFITCKAAIERMGESLSIVNIGSVSGLRANRGRAAYGASKAAVKLMSEVMALEFAGQNVRVNCVAPGPIDTPLVARLHKPEDRQVWLRRTPLQRYGKADEVAAAIAFLLSPEASYINGHTLAVDGGFSTAGIIGEN